MLRSENTNYIEEMMDIFHNSTGIACVLFDDEGNELYSSKKSNNYCKFLQGKTTCHHDCKKEHKESRDQSRKLGEAYISYCNAGVVYYTISIDNSKFTGSIQGGPVHMTEPDLAIVETTALSNNLNEVDASKLTELYNDIPVISPSTARYQLKLLSILASDINEYTKEQLRKTKEILDEQRSISENLQEVKFLESMASSTIGYPIHLENELSECIVRGSEEEAKAILNELLGHIFFKHSGDNKRIIVMSIELVVVMSRAAIQGGARYEDVSKLTRKIYNIALDNTNIEEICLWLTKIVERMILLVFPITTDKSDVQSILRKAIIFINQNIQNNVSLDDVAKYVSLSSTYFSKLFSTEMSMTYIDYLNTIRIRESKKFLADDKMSLGEIAAKLGFNDQSYFTKVFKKHEGITPGKYRKQNF